MELKEFLSNMNSEVIANSDTHQYMHKLAQEALQITSIINNGYHTPEEITKLFEELIGKKWVKILVCFRLFIPIAVKT